MDNLTLDIKPIYLDWKVRYKKIKALFHEWQMSSNDPNCSESLPEVDLVQRVLADPKPLTWDVHANPKC